MKTLAIETSCDDTSLAIVSYKDWFFDIEKCLLHSQIQQHKKYGWVVPELASRLHEEKIVDLINEIWINEIKNVDFISYTCCPGLPGSLLVWTTVANTLSLFLDKEKVPVHHINGHILSILCERNIDDIQFPLLVLTVSWWHNDLYIVAKSDYKNSNLDKYLDLLKNNYSQTDENLVRQVGQFVVYKVWFTLDDASGEAFDKVSKMLEGPYPGGKWIYDQASKFNFNTEEDISFPRIYLKKNEFNFSFSWLKAQVNYKIQSLKEKYGTKLPDEIISHIAYEFQQAVVETLWRKLFKASEYFNIKNIACVGGVSANEKLKSYIKSNLEKYNIQNFYTPVKNLYSTDNAAMIWVAGIVGSNAQINIYTW